MVSLETDRGSTAGAEERVNYEAFENKPVRIIILDESTTQDTQEKTSNFIAKYSQNPIMVNKHTPFLSRDEANER